MTKSLPIKFDYQDLIDEIVCNRNINTCMLRDYVKCPYKENLRNYFHFLTTRKILHTNNGKQQIALKSSLSQTDLETYIEKLITKIYKLKSPHFLTMMQSGYLKKL